MCLYYLYYFFGFLVVTSSSTNYTHGFVYDTYIRSGNNPGWLLLNQVAHTVAQGKKQYVTSYSHETNQWETRSVKASARSKTNCYCRIRFDEFSVHDVLCSPTQLFYRIADRAWVPAYDLNSGDCLLGESSSHVSVLSMHLVRQPLSLYTLEIEKTHTFCVGAYCVAAHNMLAPITAAVGISIPFSTGCGGSIGLVFGPAGIIGGSCLGGLIGYIIKTCINHTVHKYELSFNPASIESYINSKNALPNDKIDEAQSPGKPTEKDGFIPKKKWDGKKVGHRRGHGWPDQDGNIWIPTGPNGHGGPHWDVQKPRGGYDNVFPGGKVRGQK